MVGGHTFPKGVHSKVNVITWLEFELAYNDVIIQHFSNYAKEIPPLRLKTVEKKMYGYFW